MGARTSRSPFAGGTPALQFRLLRFNVNANGRHFPAAKRPHQLKAPFEQAVFFVQQLVHVVGHCLIANFVGLAVNPSSKRLSSRIGWGDFDTWVSIQSLDLPRIVRVNKTPSSIANQTGVFTPSPFLRKVSKLMYCCCSNCSIDIISPSL